VSRDPLYPTAPGVPPHLSCDGRPVVHESIVLDRRIIAEEEGRLRDGLVTRWPELGSYYTRDCRRAPRGDCPRHRKRRARTFSLRDLRGLVSWQRADERGLVDMLTDKVIFPPCPQCGLVHPGGCGSTA